MISDNVMGLCVISGVCVLLPIMITWLSLRAKSNAINRKYGLLEKAIEHGVDIDPNLLIDEKNGKKSTRMRLLNKLQWGVIYTVLGIAAAICIFAIPAMKPFLAGVAAVSLALGVGYLVAYFVGRKQLQPDIMREDKGLEEKK